MEKLRGTCFRLLKVREIEAEIFRNGCVVVQNVATGLSQGEVKVQLATHSRTKPSGGTAASGTYLIRR